MRRSVKNAQVFAGLSGGVDSAVAAALLKAAGARVTGVFIKGWYPEGLPCTWSEDRRDAMRVAARLGIPFLTLDASKEYKASVIDYLIREYSAGRTPNPDVMCNRDVKFGAFYQFARTHGANFIATGHYARVGSSQGVKNAATRIASLQRKASREQPASRSHFPRLLRGVDRAKDQSYFLWAVPRDMLTHTLFPLGEMEKSDVRSLARKFGLPVAEKRDSQGVCFLGPVSIAEFLKSEIGSKPGEAIDESGSIVGMHDGALLYTLGERVALRSAPPGPWYVMAKDIAHNTLTVRHDAAPRALASHAIRTNIRLSEMNFLSRIKEGEPLIAEYRYHGPRVRGTYTAQNSAFVASEPLIGPIAPGQSLALYREDELVGGGIIASCVFG